MGVGEDWDWIRSPGRRLGANVHEGKQAGVMTEGQGEVRERLDEESGGGTGSD